MRYITFAICFVFSGAAHAAITGQWNCDDNAASTTIVATVGNNAALAGGDNTEDKDTTGPGGDYTGGLLMNGTDDYIDTSGTSTGVLDTEAYSVSMWVKFSTTPSNEGLIGAAAAANNPRLRMSDADTVEVTSDTGTIFTYDFGASVGTSAYHHILLTRNTSNSLRVFIDGVESSTGAQTVPGNISYGYFGRRNANYADAAFSGIKIFDTDESTNVATLYAEGQDHAGISPGINAAFGGLNPSGVR